MCFLWLRTRWFFQELYPAGTERGRRAGGLVRAYSHRGGPIPMRRYARVRVVVIRTLASDWDSPCSSDRSASRCPGMPPGSVCTTCTWVYGDRHRFPGRAHLVFPEKPFHDQGTGLREGRRAVKELLQRGVSDLDGDGTHGAGVRPCLHIPADLRKVNVRRARPSRRQPFLCSFRMVSSPPMRSESQARAPAYAPAPPSLPVSRRARLDALPSTSRPHAAPCGASVPRPPVRYARGVENPAHEPHGGFGDRVRVDHAPMLPAVRTHEKGLITGSSRLVQLTSRKCV